MKFQRALLAAHLERPEPTLRDAGRERGEAVEQGRGRQHAIARPQDVRHAVALLCQEKAPAQERTRALGQRASARHH
jgi:hypothetical protein